MFLAKNQKHYYNHCITVLKSINIIVRVGTLAFDGEIAIKLLFWIIAFIFILMHLN